MRILIVEDDDSVRQMLRAMLERLGCEVVEAEDGRSGVAAYDEALRSLRPFDFALLDYMLPFFNGNVVAQKIRDAARLAGVEPPRMVALTGYKDGQVFVDFQSAGVTELHVKGDDGLAGLCERIAGRRSAAV